MKHATINEFKASQPKADSKFGTIAVCALAVGMSIWCLYQAINLI